MRTGLAFDVFHDALAGVPAAQKLAARYVAKPWGRTDIPRSFAASNGVRIGEVEFKSDRDLPLLPKYLFTSERVSVQVHPNDTQARRHGRARGKAEYWYIIDAAPGSTVGLGLMEEVAEQELRQAALDGSIERLIEWRPVQSGDFLYVPPGTIHAIGGGISLIEVHQNSDVTYRLYDYGRPRELHLEDGLAVARLGRYPDHFHRRVSKSDECVLVEGPPLTLVETRSDAMEDRLRWILPLEGSATCGDQTVQAGECLLVEAHGKIDKMWGRFLIGAVS